MSDEVAQYLRELAAEFEKLVDLEGNDWMLFIYEVMPPWFIRWADGWQEGSAESAGEYLEAVHMLRTAADRLDAQK